MSIRIAFTSCSDPIDAPEQPVWNEIAAFKPDHLVLLGDQIYMDYGIGGIGSRNPGLGKPARFAADEFAAHMSERYRLQCEILQRSRLFGPQAREVALHGIWDDHDFAWNNSFGDSGSNQRSGPQDSDEPVGVDKQKISRHLMRAFYKALWSGKPYAPGPVPARLSLAKPMYCSSAGTQAVRLGPKVKLLLTDGRSFRTSLKHSHPTVFGEQQWRWIDGEVNADEVILFASACTLGRGTENLRQSGEDARLIALAGQRRARILCLTGDIHDIEWQSHGDRVFEAVASGAARPLAPSSRAWGAIEITDKAVSVSLRALDGKSTPKGIEKVIDIRRWAL